MGINGWRTPHVIPDEVPHFVDNPHPGRITAAGGWCAPHSALDALGITITDQETPMSARIVIVPAVDGKHYLRFVAANGQTLGISETYSTLSNARRAATDWYDSMKEITTQGLTASVTEEH